MKKPSPKVLMSALAVAVTFASPAFAQHRVLSQHHHRVLHSPDAPLYDYAPGPSARLPNPNIPYYGNAPYDRRDDW